MNAFALLANSWLALPFNPELCWWICLALLHTSWQVIVLGLLAVGFSRDSRFSVHSRFKTAFSTVVLIGCLPVVNYVWISQSAAPDAVSVASQQFARTGRVPLFLPSELRESPKPKLLNSKLLNSKLLNSKLTSNRLASVPSHPSAVEKTHSDSPSTLPSTIGYWKVSASEVLTICYLLGVLWMILRLANGLREQRQFGIFRQSCLATEDTQTELLRIARRAAQSLGNTLRVPIAIFSGSGTAFVVGVLRPTVLVNATLLTGLTPTQLEQVLTHELAHVYRLDPLTQLVQRIVESILFFHPVVWALTREVSQLRELCCDNLAAVSSTSAEYADTLLQCYMIQNFSGSTAESPELALPVVGQGSQFSKRINTLLESESQQRIRQAHRTSTALGILGLTSAVLLVAIVLLTWRPVAKAVAQDLSPIEQTDARWKWQSVEDKSVESPTFWFGGKRLQLSKTIPDDVDVEVMADLESCKIAQWHFGDSKSTRLAILFEDNEGPIADRIFIDSNRNRKFEQGEELTARLHDGKVWLANVKVTAKGVDGPVFAPRQIAIHPGKDTLRVKTLGFAQGELTLQGKTHSARRVDVDGNGLPVDNKDQLLIDLNSDGEFDLLSEQFLIGDHLNIDQQRYLVRSDRLGHSVTLTSDSARGQIEFLYELADKTATLETLEGSLRDKTGMLIAVRLTGKPISVPPGRYCLEHLNIQTRDKTGGTWRMTLASYGSPRWIEVTAESSQQVRLLDKFQIKAKHVHASSDHSEYLTFLEPRVKTGNGLVLTNFVHLGSGARQNPFQIADSVDFEIKNSAGEIFSAENQTCSGFN